ncbi:MAG: xanthine dehydrogenase family protein molybdopterin-binding subunit, partial [Aquabacterium sp.]
MQDSLAARTAPVTRVEDHRLITGTGLYVHDVRRPGMLHAVFVRSAHPHASLVAIDIAAASVAAGVRAVLVAADLAGACMPAINPLAKAVDAWPCPLLAAGTVRSVGQPVAVVLADSPAAAEAAAEMV